MFRERKDSCYEIMFPRAAHPHSNHIGDLSAPHHPHGYGSRNALEEYGAETIVNSVDELYSYLSSLT